ncbi:hypothetical protein [Pseudomonas sp. RIT623]|uniref:hypothetical protein n=1 Tax=Pseudomonas sp. RIT623 TaxID=2559075 RepID=UPI00106F4211|nr:hypothetical protein [Pseudomonas sp. RIT623]TFF36637.1 hypothetical protein E3U47_19295 [Pseudomonas sp. RIT623]
MKMTPAEFQAFMRRYFAMFLLGFFMCLISAALSSTLWIDSHWRHHPDNPSYTLLASAVSTLLLCTGHLAMVRGFTWAMWLVLPVPAVALLMTLSLFGSGLNALMLAIMLVLALLALLVFNSGRHREMRQRLIELRQLRR